MQIDVPVELDFSATDHANYIRTVIQTPAAREALEDLRTQYEQAASAPTLRAARFDSAAVVLTAVLKRHRLATTHGEPPVVLSAFNAEEKLPRYGNGPLMYSRTHFLGSLTRQFYDALSVFQPDADGRQVTIRFGDPETTFMGLKPTPWENDPSKVLRTILWMACYTARVPFNYVTISTIGSFESDPDELRRNLEHDVATLTTVGVFYVAIANENPAFGSALWLLDFPRDYDVKFEKKSATITSRIHLEFRRV